MKRNIFARKLLLPLALCACAALGLSAASQYRRAAFRAHVDRAAEYLAQGRGPQAEAEWQAALQIDPTNADARELLGQYAMLHGQWATGVAAFRWLQQHAPDRPHVLCRLAACSLRADDLNVKRAAYPLAEEELKRDPNCVAALGMLTAATAQQPFYENKKQLARLRLLAKLEPDDVDVLHMLAEELLEQYLYDEVGPVIAHILQVAPQDMEAYNLRGFANLGRTDPQSLQQAIADFHASLQIEPVNGGARFGLGRAYLRQGKANDAIFQLEEAQRLNPGAPRTYFELSHAYRMAGLTAKARAAENRFKVGQRREDAERQLLARTIAYPDNAEYAQRLGMMLAENGETLKALIYLERAAQLKPNDANLQAAIRTLNARARGAAPTAGDRASTQNASLPSAREPSSLSPQAAGAPSP